MEDNEATFLTTQMKKWNKVKILDSPLYDVPCLAKVDEEELPRPRHRSAPKLACPLRKAGESVGTRS